MACVLIVDDDQSIVDSLGDILSDQYDVEKALNGCDALAVLARCDVDVIILDLMMPVLDGASFVAEMRRLGLDVPIILASASNDLQHSAQSLRVADFVRKPFRIDALEAKLARVIGGAGPCGGSTIGGGGGGQRGDDGNSGAGGPSASERRGEASLLLHLTTHVHLHGP
jgi:DNA-binding response OmpR family regulator